MTQLVSALRRGYGIARSTVIYRGNLLKLRRARAFYRQFIQPGDLCFDIGAHLGDRGLPNDELEDIKAQLTPNSSALIVQVEHEWAGTLKDSLETKAVSSSARQMSLSEQFQSAASRMEPPPTPTE